MFFCVIIYKKYIIYKERSEMYEYKVETYKIKDAADAMNALAGQGWRVIAVSPNMAQGFGIVVTYEKKKLFL